MAKKIYYRIKVNISNNLKEVSNKITKHKLGLAIMEKKIVKGIITDGDTRRSLRFNYKTQALKKLMNSNPIFISENSMPYKPYR